MCIDPFYRPRFLLVRNPPPRSYFLQFNLTILRCALQHGRRQGCRGVSNTKNETCDEFERCISNNPRTGVDGVDLVIGTSSFLR